MAVILAIETSCDETSVAIVKNRKVLSQVVASQIATHQAYGGVVPEVASRQHLLLINPCLEQTLKESGLTWADITAIAATVAPGLVGSLMVGLTAAKTLAVLYQKPFLGVHHLEGHIYAAYLDQPQLEPPFLCLLVSGGHTSLIEVKGCGQYRQLGTTRDDAAGEAFDKVARLLDLGYPGGPAIDQAARLGNPQAFPLPPGRISLPEGGYHPYDSSFSGLKTAMLRLVNDLKSQPPHNLPVADLAASFQETVALSLTAKTIRCALDHGLQNLVVGGGVAANSCLRHHLQQAGTQAGIQVYFPPLKFCTDNAAMIACAGAAHFQQGDYSPLTLGVQSRLSIEAVNNLYLQA
jgi:N6-L-threonylcarbamoyladenine synthase